MSSLTFRQAETIATETLRQGRALSLKPLTVAVLDAGGHLIILLREDGASNLRPQIATGKASGALALGVSSRKIAEMMQDRPAFVASVAGISSAGIVPTPGGVIIVDTENMPLGAVGVTGDTSDNDETCALAGIAASGLFAQR